jgi:hypothetical protein
VEALTPLVIRTAQTRQLLKDKYDARAGGLCLSGTVPIWEIKRSLFFSCRFRLTASVQAHGFEKAGQAAG